ncbi:MAG: Alanine-tRNA ligase [Candidatus Jorgensenbacteria bacterium GW2011_GWA1_48_13]|uniref:alanine--tRNA ligase n=2 Tax=Candidatus Joergenseniibacteriota TaxID=1752739 RepID=A0A0G1YKD2_9BACT|nr:MAG: Alanine-tRNA ligase [Candidatus Jorgensenbacteria bacterium GW2011_GWA1_48_13]KKW15477.1 MAG: Alanine-tRNA ligase [Candidatus Jorgensenbacteria bacterium GW2011_GWB1_50_10]
MKSEDIRKKFLEFFANRGHAIVPSSSLIPDDPSVLLTTAGMQQFKRYYTGELDPMKDFGSYNTASIQKSFRTSDIDEVGDESHLTFFEMLGNFSFGGYFKEKAVEYGREFIEDVMGLKIDYVTVFDPTKVPAGDWRKGVPRDDESRAIWEKLGVKDIRAEGTEVFWGPTGAEGPCGPTTEIYVNGVEVWNIVFNEFYCDKNRKLAPLKTPGVDTGMGLERLAMVAQNVPTIFETDLFNPLISLISGKLPMRVRRIISDHIRGIAFLVSDGVRPSNKDAGYMLRRLMRRVIAYAYRDNIGSPPQDILRLVVDQYRKFPDYRNLNSDIVIKVFSEEYEGYKEKVGPEIKATEKIFSEYKAQGKKLIPPAVIFGLHQSAGVTFDISSDIAEELGVEVDRKAFEQDLDRHKKISRAGGEKKFGGHGLILNTGELKAGSEEELKKVTRLHTATHLLNQALRDVLGKDVRQMGSDITVERTRFDFTFPRKMTADEVKKVEKIVNEKIEENLPVGFKEMPKTEAEATGALHFFKSKYPERVKIYYVGKSLEDAWSKEFCGGPHVTRIGEIGKFRIIKEEASSAGVRRIRAIVG